MPVIKLIRIFKNGKIKEDICFEKKNKTFIQELQEGLTPEIRKRVSISINRILKLEDGK